MRKHDAGEVSFFCTNGSGLRVNKLTHLFLDFFGADVDDDPCMLLDGVIETWVNRAWVMTCAAFEKNCYNHTMAIQRQRESWRTRARQRSNSPTLSNPSFYSPSFLRLHQI